MHPSQVIGQLKREYSRFSSRLAKWQPRLLEELQVNVGSTAYWKVQNKIDEMRRRLVRHESKRKE